MPRRLPHGAIHPNEVGSTIRRFRVRAGISTRELARRTGVAASYVSKIELGHLGARATFCRSVARALGLSPAERTLLDALVALYRVEHHPVNNGTNALQHAQQAIRKLERTCRSYRMFQLSLVPGLMQTRDYARSIFSRLTSRAHREASVKERLGRQHVLEDQGRSFRVLLSDWAFGAHWCSGRVMSAQRKHLLGFARRPNIDIRVVARDFRFPKAIPPFVTGFEVLDESLVIVDTLSNFTTWRNTDEVASYVRAFDEVFTHAPALTSDVVHGSHSPKAA